MTRKCYVYGFKSNYDSPEESYSVFTFPRDETLRQEWIRKIPNANLTPTKYTCICEKHFTVEEVNRFPLIEDKQVSTVSKGTVEGIHKRLPDCDLIRSVNSHLMIWMEKFVAWLQWWKLYSMNHSKSFLTNDAFMGLLHTVKMTPDLLQHHKYILLSKFRTDNSEDCFGLYKQLSGCNNLVSMKYVIHSERKLKIKGLFRLFTASR